MFSKPSSSIRLKSILHHSYFSILHSCTKAGLWLSHLEKSFISVKHLKAEINVNAQYVYMTTSSGCCWIVVWLIFTVQLCEIDMYRCGENWEGYEGITVSHYRLECIKLYCLYIRRNYMYYLQKHIIRTSSPMEVLHLWYDEEWYCQSLLHKYRTDNNPPKFWSPSSFGIIWSHTVGWSPYRLMVARQVQWLCCRQEWAEAWG